MLREGTSRSTQGTKTTSDTGQTSR
jgi:hypothetical protein